MQHRYAHEMAYTLADIERLLPAAVASVPYTCAGDGEMQVYTYSDGPRSWTITATARPDRRIALMSIPVSMVEIVLEGHDNHAAGAFYARFMLYFQRGGG